MTPWPALLLASCTAVAIGCSSPMQMGGVDGGLPDAMSQGDGGSDVPVGMMDVAPGADAQPGIDVPIGTMDVQQGTDAPTSRDVLTAGDGGCGVTVQIMQPTSGEMVESCSRPPSPGSMSPPRFYDFQATVTGGTPTLVVFHWIDPANDPPSAVTSPDFTTYSSVPTNVTIAGTTYTASRQIGGGWLAMSPGPLNEAGTGAWHVVVTATVGTCSVTADGTFDLTHSLDTSCTFP
jgi:hypothetical protein